MKRVLVTGAGGPAGVNFIKALRLAPERMHLVGTDVNKFHLEWPDVDGRYLVPPCTAADYLDKLNAVVEREGITFVHPQPDAEVRVLSGIRKRLKAGTFLPADETIRICQDKMETNRLLGRAGVPVPESYSLVARGIDDCVAALLPKGGKVWLRAIRGMGSRGSLPVTGAEQARMWIAFWERNHSVRQDDFMAAEYLPGREIAFQSVWKDGELVVSQARERLEYVFGNLMPSGQSSSPVVAVTINRDDVNDIATRAVLAVDKRASGIFCIDMKENREGVPCVTEINAGRFFTTSNFFAAAGVNMPYLYLKLGMGEEPPALPKYNPLRPGLYWVRNIDCDAKLVEDGRWRSTVA